MSTFITRHNYGDDAEYDNWVEKQVDPEWTGTETDHFGWMADRAQSRAERDRGAADPLWLVMGAVGVALPVLAMIEPRILWAMFGYVALAIPVAVVMGRRIGGRP